ncbi:MAG: FtsQ-type POTRA domain-containing protein [Clostridia bacterium]|nr:FtsQ-type POTRA domain-containing protein [Clostridia bacterium]
MKNAKKTKKNIVKQKRTSNVNSKTERSVAKPKQNKRKRLFGIMLFWIIVLTISATIVYGAYYLYTAESLKVKNLKIENSNHYDPKKVKEVASIEPGKNMLLLNRGKIKKDITQKLPYIEDVKIKIGKNGILRIIIKERISKYVLNDKNTSKHIRVDKYGIILEEVPIENISIDELTLFGLILEKELNYGTKILETEYVKVQRFEQIEKVYKESKIEEKITSVRFENSKVILTLDYKIEVVAEEQKDLDYKMRFLKEILKEVSGRSGKIDITKEKPTFVEKIGK